MTTTSRFRGMSQSRPFRLWTRAPRMAIGSSLASSFTLGPKHHLTEDRPRCRPGGPVLRCRASKTPHARGSATDGRRRRQPAPVVDRRYQQALDLFEKAVKALGRKDLDRARDLLDELLEGHADQQELVERARAYRAMCDRSPPSGPAQDLRGAPQLRGRPPQPGRLRPGRPLPAAGPGDPPPARERALLPRRRPGPRRRRAGGPQGPAARRSTPARRAAPRPAGRRLRAAPRPRPSSRRSSRLLCRDRQRTASRPSPPRASRIEDPATHARGRRRAIVEPGRGAAAVHDPRGPHGRARGGRRRPVRAAGGRRGRAGRPGPRPLPAARVAWSRRAPASAPSPTSGRRAGSASGRKVGNFVELKKTHLGEGAKAQHLTYLGDARSGPASTSARARSPATTTA